jgi:tetratricopeptide (TPR) repeat protein
MRLSLCMIVRDEERHLGRTLASVQPIADEIVVVDTGSVDATIAVARTHGASVFTFDWADDFSLARNFSISRASGQWILILDADEVLATRDHAKLRGLLDDPTCCWTFTTRNYTSDPAMGGFQPVSGDYPDLERGHGGYFEGAKVRLFPRDPALSFEGPIHELVEPAIRRTGRYIIRRSDVPIHHYGHAVAAGRDQNERKALLYRRAGERKVERHPTEWQGYFELALEYANAREFNQSLTYFERAAQLNPRSSDVLTNMGYAQCELERFSEAVPTLEQALRLNPQNHEALGNLGVTLLRMGDPAAAATALMRAVELAPAFVNGHVNLGRALMRTGKLAEGVASYERALSLYPAYTAAKLELGTLLVFLKRHERAESLLLDVLETEPRNAAALYNLGLLYQAQGRASDALSAFERFLAVSDDAASRQQVTQICGVLRQTSEREGPPAKGDERAGPSTR